MKEIQKETYLKEETGVWTKIKTKETYYLKMEKQVKIQRRWIKRDVKETNRKWNIKTETFQKENEKKKTIEKKM